jgi:hypothetical protein
MMAAGDAPALQSLFTESQAIWPILGMVDKSGADRILFKVKPLFISGFFATQETIETSALPLPACVHVTSYPAFQRAYQIAHLRLSIVRGRSEKMDMVRHHDRGHHRPVAQFEDSAFEGMKGFFIIENLCAVHDAERNEIDDLLIPWQQYGNPRGGGPSAIL